MKAEGGFSYVLRRMCVVILIFVLGLYAHQVFAEATQKEDNVAGLQYTHIDKMGGSFDIKNGTAICCGNGRSRYTDTSTTVRVSLQKRAVHSKEWIPVCSWSRTTTGNVTARVNEEKKISTGYAYRIYIKCIIKDREGIVLETDSRYSRIVSY